MYLDQATRRTLLAKGLLVPLPEQDGDSRRTLRPVVLNPGLKADMHAIYVQTLRNKPLDAALGLADEPHELHLGCAFLSQFTTGWGAWASKIFLWAPQ